MIIAGEEFVLIGGPPELETAGGIPQGGRGNVTILQYITPLAKSQNSNIVQLLK
jgi:hypothetical protein